MYKLTLFLLLSFLASCTTTQSPFMAQNGTPLFEFKDHHKYLKARRPASVQVTLDQNTMNEHSNLQVYFFSLYHQFQKLNQLAKNKATSLGSCPQFHHNLIEKKGEFKNVEIFTDLNPRTRSALTQHNARNLVELKELCETGSSDNYYVFENFIRHLHTHPRYYYDQDAPLALNRVPVIANLILIESLMNRTLQAGLTRYEFEAVNRLKSEWIMGYVEDLKISTRELQLKDKTKDKQSFQNAWNFHSRSFGK